METLRKKIIFWVSLASAMVVVLVIWLMSLESYNFSESKEQIQEIKEQVQEKLQDIEIPETPDLNSVGAGLVPAPEGQPQELPLLPLSE